MKEFAKWCKKNLKEILCLHVKKDNQFYADFKKIGNVKEDKTTVFIVKKDFTTGYHFPHPKATSIPCYMQTKASYNSTRTQRLTRSNEPLIQKGISEKESNTPTS